MFADLEMGSTQPSMRAQMGWKAVLHMGALHWTAEPPPYKIVAFGVLRHLHALDFT